MRLTIDSNERLEQVLPVVAALYGVSLQVEGGNSQPSARGGRGGRRGSRGRQSSGTARAGRRGSTAPGATIREWARSQGYQISDRGPIPGEVKSAFQAANR